MKKARVNSEITAPEIFLIGAQGEKIGLVKIRQALDQASEADLDLVEIAPSLGKDAKPPVCRIMDYRKYCFDQKKKVTGQKKKQTTVQQKEIKLTPNTGGGDYLIKVQKANRFLEEGNKVKFTVRFRGRELSYPELGLNLLRRLVEDVKEFGTVEQFPKMEGRQATVLVLSKKKL